MPRIFTVYHNPNFTDHFRSLVNLADCEAVCTVQVPDGPVERALEFVYLKANSVGDAFWRNREVTLLGGRTGARSLSAGDVVLTDQNEAWLCANCGWVPLAKHNIDLPIVLARHDAALADEFNRMGHKPNVTWPTGRPSTDPRWRKGSYHLSPSFMIGDYPEGKDRIGYYWQGHTSWTFGLIYWPDTGKCWVVESGAGAGVEKPRAVVSDIGEAKAIARDLNSGGAETLPV